jgi:hypothetical protein
MLYLKIQKLLEEIKIENIKEIMGLKGNRTL